MTTALIIIVWIALTISAYPKNKRFFIEEDCKRFKFGKNWTVRDMLETMVVCLFFWWFVWLWFLFTKIGDWIDNLEFLNKKSRF